MWYRYVSALAAFFLLPVMAWFCVNCEQADRYIAGMERGGAGAEEDVKAAGRDTGSAAQPAAFYFSSERTEPADPMPVDSMLADPMPGVPVMARGGAEKAVSASEGGRGDSSGAASGTASGGGIGSASGAALSGLSGEDYETLLRIVEAEAGTEDGMGKLLVADVVLNRVESESFPDTVRQVVYQQANGHAQFSPVADGSIERVEVSEETEAAVRRALRGEDISEGALYFAAREAADPESMKWFDENLTPLFSYGGHEFFR